MLSLSNSHGWPSVCCMIVYYTVVFVCLQSTRSAYEVWSKRLRICHAWRQRYTKHVQFKQRGLQVFLTPLNSATKAMRFTPTPQVPALQYIGSVEKGGSADIAGLSTGDFLLEVSRCETVPLTGN